MKKPSFITFLIFVLLCVLSSPSLAIMKALSTEELTNASDIVIEGEVEKAEAQWSKDGKSIFTSADIVVTTVVKGKESKKKIKVEYDGGEIGEIGMKVSDQSLDSLKKGEKVLLFLKAGKSKKDGDAYNIVGKNQGSYKIDQNGIAKKSGFTIVGTKEKIDNNIPVDKLIEKIKKVR